ncbi:MAG: lambda-exonuclease family protein [Bacteroidota bacterium]|jgi:putative phage-type endonuclease
MNTYKTSINTKEMSREEWLKSRRIGIGGSDVSAILGFDRYRTPLDIYFEKTSEEIIEKSVNAKMKAGLMLEDVIADWFREETGLVVRRDNKIRIHKEIPFLLANIDRLITGSDGPGVLEIKTTSGWIARNWEDGDVPLDYYAQLQHYLSVTGYDYGYFAVLVDGWDFRIFKQDRDNDFIKSMNEQLIDFWIHVEKGDPPEPINSEDVKKLYPQHTEGVSIEAKKETYEVYNNLLQVRKLIKELEAAELEYIEFFKKIMKDAESIEYEGRKLISWKAAKPKKIFQSKIFQKEHPELYNNYVIEIPSVRTFLLKELKEDSNDNG